MTMNKMLQENARDGKKGKRARVLLADDHPAVAKELCALLQTEFDVIATVGDGEALLAAAHALAPDVIVTDIAMPALDGIAAASEILRRNPAARICVCHCPRRSRDGKEKLGHRQDEKLKLSDPITQKLDFSLSKERQPDAAYTRWNTNRR